MNTQLAIKAAAGYYALACLAVFVLGLLKLTGTLAGVTWVWVFSPFWLPLAGAVIVAAILWAIMMVLG